MRLTNHCQGAKIETARLITNQKKDRRLLLWDSSYLNYLMLTMHLEPHIDARTMEIHHTKHHNGYTTKLNAALEKAPALAEKSIEEILSDLSKVPEEIRTAVRNNGGGFANHSLFWQVMSPNGGGEPSGDLAKAISAAFGDFAAFKDAFSKAAATRFGSGWGWLAKKADGSLLVTSTPNQDSVISEGLTPLSWPGCVGACILSKLSEPSSRLHCSLVERGKLG